MATTQHSSPPPNIFNIVEHNNNHLKHKHGEQEDDEQQEVFEYSHHEDEPPPRPSCGSSRTSLSSSPSHEFSFTVCSLYTSQLSSTTAAKNVLKDSLTSSSSTAATAIDLSPADEIFFHGHLLPLHLLSGGHLSTSPRSSTNSLDSFTLPITSLSSTSNNNDSSMDQAGEDRALDSMEKPKSRSFSLFRNRATTTAAKSRKSPDNQESPENRSKPHHDDDNNHNQHHQKNLNNKVRFDLSNAIKLVRSLLIFKQGNNSNTTSSSTGRKTGIQMRGQTFSYSGNLSSPSSNRQGGEVLRGRFSAPASMKTSPTNSGMFLEAAPRNKNSNSNSDSTMEELQAAIQAAIAHCKNSSIAAAAASSCSR